MEELHTSQEVGYLIYCPTEEELEDGCLGDLKDDLRWELGNEVVKHDKAGMQMVAQSLYQDGNANVSQGLISSKDLPSEKAPAGEERYPEANHMGSVERTLPNFPSSAALELQFDSPHRKSFMAENSSGQAPHHNVGFEEHNSVAEKEEAIDMIDPSNSHRNQGGSNSPGEMALCEIGEPTEIHALDCSCDTCTQNEYAIRTQRARKPCKCSYCDKEFRYDSQLIRHMKIHTGERPFQCPLCDKAFTQKTSLATHMSVHSGKKPFQCSICNKAFSHSSYLHTHMKIHRGERPHGCILCEKRFADRKKLDRHMRSHTGEQPYHCTVCNKRFSQRHNLTVHMRHHTGERPFECSVCQRRFYASIHLNSHMRTHTGERPYKCSVCSKDFSHSSSFYIHMRVHTGRKPHQCSICDKQFSQSCSLSRHMKTHNRKEEEKEEP